MGLGFLRFGKSSFTKYLGLALDDSIQVDGQPFSRHLNDRLTRPQTKALLDAVNKRLSAAVIMLDLASQQIAGATLAEVSTVLFYKVLQELGYSRNMKVAALERKLKKDKRYEEFRALFKKKLERIGKISRTTIWWLIVCFQTLRTGCILLFSKMTKPSPQRIVRPFT